MTIRANFKLSVTIATVLFLFTMLIESSSQPRKEQPTRYVKVPSGYLMVLRQGDDLTMELEKFAMSEKIPSANFTGMGFVDITFGFFDFQSKKYNPKDFKGVELASMHGTVAWKEMKPSIHAHGVVGDKDFKSYAGHILNAVVSTGSLEIFITVHDKPFERKKDESIGADVLRLEP